MVTIIPPSDIGELQRAARKTEFIQSVSIKETYSKLGIDTRDMQAGELRELSGNISTFNRISAFRGDFPILSKLLFKIRKNTKDISPLLKVFSRHFFRTNKKLIFSQFQAGAPPFFAPLKVATLLQKPSNTPILVSSGNLMSSLISPKDPEAINIITPRSLRVGTKVPYAAAHQTGYRDVPPRPPVQIAAGGRLTRWVKWASIYATRLDKRDIK